jgi:hypothetical protein
VVDPYLGVGSAACAAVLHDRKAAGADVVEEYLRIAADRARLAWEGKLPRRPVDRPVYVPRPTDRIAQMPLELERSRQAMCQAHINPE